MTLTRVEYGKLIELGIFQSDEPNELIGGRYARCEVFDASARVTPLAARGARIRVGDLLPLKSLNLLAQEVGPVHA